MPAQPRRLLAGSLRGRESRQVAAARFAPHGRESRRHVGREPATSSASCSATDATRRRRGYAHLADGHLVEAAEEKVGTIIAEAMDGVNQAYDLGTRKITF